MAIDTNNLLNQVSQSAKIRLVEHKEKINNTSFNEREEYWRDTPEAERMDKWRNDMNTLLNEYKNCSSRFLSRLVCWNYAAFFIFSAVGSGALVREIGGRQAAVRRRRTCPVVFSRLYHDQLSAGNSMFKAWVASNFKIAWAMHKKTGQRRTPSPLRPW